MESERIQHALHVVDDYLGRFACDVVEVKIQGYDDDSVTVVNVTYLDDERFDGSGNEAAFRIWIRESVPPGRSHVVVSDDTPNNAIIEQYECAE